METKKCNVCGVEKSLSEFHRNGPGKWYSTCRTCRAEQRGGGKRLAADALIDSGFKQCSSCGKTKPLTEFGSRSARKRNPYTSECSSCRRQREKEQGDRCKQEWAETDGSLPLQLVTKRPGREPKDPTAPKRCGDCGETKPPEEFYIRRDRPNQRNSRCIACELDRAKSRRDNEDGFRYRSHIAHLRHRYHLSYERYQEMLEEQGGCCAICDTNDPGTQYGWFCVDHDHACCSGKTSCGKCIRALLCNQCNRLLGVAQDDEDRLFASITYLRRHRLAD